MPLATSGTISKTQFPTRLVIEQAYRKCRIPAQSITGEMIDVAFNELYLMLSEWANDGIQLWCIEKLVLPLYEAQAALPVPLGTVDILNANLRQTTQQIGTIDQIPSSYQLQFTSPTQITTIGLIWTAAATQLVFSTSSDGVTWTPQGNISVVGGAGVRTWTDFDATPATLYARLQTVDASALPISNFYFGNNPYEITIARLNRDDYINLPNKTFQGRPLQYWYDRQRDIPLMTLWPAPSAAYITNQITVWRKRYIMDVGTPSQSLDIPQRWYDATVYNLAIKLAESTPQVDPNIMTILAPKATMAMLRARAEERDNSPTYWSPNLRGYTR